jgi:hypothetical protein
MNDEKKKRNRKSEEEVTVSIKQTRVKSKSLK